MECGICWDEIESKDAAALTCCLEDDSWWWWPAEGCPQLHKSCLSRYLLIQAESGYFPATCPFCLRKLSVLEVFNNLQVSDALLWTRLQDRWLELREGRENRSPRERDLAEAAAMAGLGCRRCPSCGAWIEKQEAGWVTGCDKMTCRCGAQFCFACGSVNAMCSCSLGHGFLDREMVLANYEELDLFEFWPFHATSTEEPGDVHAEPGDGQTGAAQEVPEMLEVPSAPSAPAPEPSAPEPAPDRGGQAVNTQSTERSFAYRLGSFFI
ncbi:unnamed protein product [Effrenium voratum]|nr:unnamed protein product [Effrenium voratum]